MDLVPDRLIHHMTSSIPPMAALSETDLLSADHSILERAYMVGAPFGTNEQGEKITDVSGTHILACLEYMEEYLTKTRGPESAAWAVDHLCRLLNARIRDSAHHVSPVFLRNVWNSYSYEFLCYLREFCKELSGDPHFHYQHAYAKLISPLFQTLTRPFSLRQIYKMGPYWAQKYTKGAVEAELEETTSHSAVWRLRFTDRTLRQFGPYRRACAKQICDAIKGRMAAAPMLIHGLSPATVTDRTCIAHGDEWCEWEITWKQDPNRLGLWPVWNIVAGLAVYATLSLAHPQLPAWETIGLALFPLMVSWWVTHRCLQRAGQSRETVIQEQLQFIEVRYEELRDAYAEQERTRVELRRKITQLTALYRTGLHFNSTLDREALVQTVLETLIQDLHYDRAMISLYDPSREVLHDVRICGVSEDIAAFVRHREFAVGHPDGFPGKELREGRPRWVPDIRAIWDRLTPDHQHLATLTGAKAFVWVPLRAKDRILGTLIVDRTAQDSLTQDDLELMVTVANQVAIALDNAAAYAQIEAWNAGLEAKVRERTAELERADQIRSLFLSHVSHELRTPLTSVKGFVENLLDGLTGSLNPKQQRYLGRIGDNVDRLIRMINDLLDRIRSETGQLTLSPSEVDVEHCVAEVVDQLRPLAVEKHQRLDTRFTAAGPIVVADRDRLIQIVTNLVQNAIKFTPSYGHVSVEVTLAGEGFARLLVQDTGSGIPEEFLEKIFDPFFRLGQTHSTTSRGLGLGLSIVKTLVELHGGHITVASELGRGSTFHVLLPLAPTATDVASSAPAGAGRILVVDDDPDIRQLLVDRLGSHGYLVSTAADGAQALTLFQEEVFTGVLLDIGLPQIDGIEVLRHIRKGNQRTPIIMVTAAVSKELAVRAISMGAQAYVLKPFNLPELLRVVAHWFGHADAPAELRPS